MISETKFRKKIKVLLPDAYIKKMPDYKTIGTSNARGLPDYLIINHGDTFWAEVKKIKGKTLARYHFTQYQLIEFKKMMDAGAIILIYVNGELIPFKELVFNKTVKII